MRRFCFALVGVSLLQLASARAIEPKQMFIVVNKKSPASKEIALHYCAKRGVPKENVVELDLPTGEDVSRSDYDKLLAEPLRAALKDKKDQVKVLLTIYGVPLRVGRTEPSKVEKAQLEKLRPMRDELRAKRTELDKERARLEKLNKEKPTKETALELKSVRVRRDEVNSRVRSLEAQMRRLSHSESRASVDSELSLLWDEKYPLDRWQTNRLNWQLLGRVKFDKPPMIMTARLDGPSPALIKRLIDQSVEVEKKGLQGKVYVDARGISYQPGKSSTSGYNGYDQSLRDMAALLKEQGKMDVVLDNKSALFAPQSCRECALYCGWYSHAKFVDCCRFVPGAVAYHIASSEAVSLRRANVKYWCKNLLEKGAVATLGPVAEPYTVGFPKPAEFFGFLATGEYTLVECYWRSQMLTSWMSVLVGDPLYNPYKKNPLLKVEQVKASPARK